MEHHAVQMDALVWAVLLLDDASAAEIAGEIAGRPVLAKVPAGETDTVNAMLPPRFFKLQDQLAADARTVAALAAEPSRKPGSLARALGNMTATCVACHTAYLRGPADTPDDPESGD